MKQMVGPGFYERWSQWKSCSEDQKSRAMARVELEKILSSEKEHGPHLAYEEVTTVRRNLATLGLDVDNELIRETWYPVFRKNFLRLALGKCYDCRKGFWMYQQVELMREVIFVNSVFSGCGDRSGLWRRGPLLESPADVESHR